jgi:DNA-directed RNA polymerase specialized sigma24 family protein
VTAAMPNKEKEIIEELLNNYRRIKAKVATEAIKDAPEYALQAINYNKVGSGETNNTYSDVEEFVARKSEQDSKYKNLVKARNIIYHAYINLPIEMRRIVEYFYFNDMSVKDTASRVNCSENTIRNRKPEIFAELKVHGLMSAWEFWLESRELLS